MLHKSLKGWDGTFETWDITIYMTILEGFSRSNWRLLKVLEQRPPNSSALLCYFFLHITCDVGFHSGIPQSIPRQTFFPPYNFIKKSHNLIIFLIISEKHHQKKIWRCHGISAVLVAILECCLAPQSSRFPAQPPCPNASGMAHKARAIQLVGASPMAGWFLLGKMPI